MLNLTTNSNHVLEAILSSIGAGVIVVDPSGNFLIFNKIASELLGDARRITDAANSSRACGFYEHDKFTLLSDEENPLAQAMAGKSVEKHEIFVRNAKFPFGGWCSVTIRPLLLEGTSNSGGVIIIEDVTSQRQLKEEVARSNRDLQQFAYVAAHDLQEPIRSIIGFGELLEQNLGANLPLKAEDYLRRILAASKRMQSLIAALLLYARIETRAKPPEECDCNRLLNDVIEDMGAAIDAVGALVETGPMPIIYADYSQLSQVFHNLIANALKYKRATPSIKVSCTEEAHAHHFCVADNGIGIDMQFADRIFVIFQRLHSKSEYEGVGIGLSLCKKVVENHGGRIWIQSQLGEGTEVHFTLPITTRGGSGA